MGKWGRVINYINIYLTIGLDNQISSQWEFVMSRIKVVKANRKSPKKDICECCGVNLKYPSFRYLCLQCYSENAGVVGDGCNNILIEDD